MRRIVLTLTDDEYAMLEASAEADRRTVREMAAWLVTRPQFQADWTYRPQPNVPLPQPQPFPPPGLRITSTDRTTGVRCYACEIPGSIGGHVCTFVAN